MTSSQPLTHQAEPAVPTPAGRPIRQLQRAGGIASLVEAATYLTGFGVMLAYLEPRGFSDAQGDPAASLSFLQQNHAALYLWYLLIYLVAGAALVVLTVGIHDRLGRDAPALAPVSTAFGLIWSGLVLASGLVALVGQRAVLDLAADDRLSATYTWSSISVVQGAIGGAIEIVGALWVLLLSAAAIRTRLLPRGLALLGIVIGVAGVGTLVPQLEIAAPVFGLGFIVWYVWVGRSLLRGR